MKHKKKIKKRIEEEVAEEGKKKHITFIYMVYMSGECKLHIQFEIFWGLTVYAFFTIICYMRRC